MRDAPDFDRLAALYRWLEYLSFGPFLWRCRVHRLPQLTHCRSALVLGDGDGRFTSALLRKIPQVRVHAVDLSPRMLAALEAEAGMEADRVTTEVADLRAWSPEAGAEYDLIVTHFFLDCLTSDEVATLALRLGGCAAAAALWVVSDFAVPPTRFGRWIATPLVTGLYYAFGWLTGLRQRSLPDHATGVAQAGWSLRSKHRQLAGLLFSELWERPTLPSGRPSELQ